jgi:gluconate 2-dehydrogenase gamma chain
MADQPSGRGGITRRDLLKTAGAAGAAALIPGGATAQPASAPATPPVVAPPAGPLMNLTASETEILAAMVDRLIPSDDMGPGALEAGAVRFIDRALSEAESDSVDAYRAGLAALDRYARYSRGAPFVELSDVNMVKGHTWQGTFGDPAYGGNVNFIGWDILGYPGVRMRVSADDQRLMEEGELPPARRSAYEYGQFQLDRGA